MAIYDFFLSRNGVPVTAENYVGHSGRLFYDDANGVVKLSDGVTPGGQPIPYTIATDTIVGGIKEGPGVTIDSEGVIFIDSAGLEFTFGDFSGTVGTYPIGHADVGEAYALLGSINANEDIVIASNGTGQVEIIGEFNVRPANGTVGGALLVDPVFTVAADGVITILVDPVAIEAGIDITSSSIGIQVSPSNTGTLLHLTGENTQPTRMYIDGVGSYPIIIGRRYNLSGTTPTQALNGDVLFRIAPNGAIVDGSFNALGAGKMEWRATEDQTATAQGGSFSIFTTANGVTGFAAEETFKLESQLATITGALTVSGHTTLDSYTGRKIHNTRDAGIIADAGSLLIDFALDDIVIAEWANDITVNYTNFTAGACVELFLYKTAGTGVDNLSLDGVLAENVSGATTTFAASAGETVFLTLTSTTTAIGGLYIRT
jgi:hypothetical protein